MPPSEDDPLSALREIRDGINDIDAERRHYQALAERLGSELAEIKGCLSEVAVYEGSLASAVSTLRRSYLRFTFSGFLFRIARKHGTDLRVAE